MAAWSFKMPELLAAKGHTSQRLGYSTVGIIRCSIIMTAVAECKSFKFTLIQSFQAFMPVAHDSAFCIAQFGRKCSAAIFRVSELVLLDAEVVQKKKTVNYTGQFEAVSPIMSNVT
jgi:hypothetical protein